MENVAGEQGLTLQQLFPNNLIFLIIKIVKKSHSLHVN